MLKSYVCFDLETTGLDPLYNEIIEIGALKVRDGKVAERFMEFIHPQEEISPMITNLTGITNEMVANLEAAGSAVNTETNKINFGFWEIGTFMKIYQIFGHPRKGCKNFCCYFFCISCLTVIDNKII